MAEISRWNPGSTGVVVAAELLFTFLPCFVILNVGTSRNTVGNEFYGLAIGLTVIGGAFTVGAISLASFNPAVSFGFAIMGNVGWADLWMHLFPQVLGGVLAAFAFKGIFPDDT